MELIFSLILIVILVGAFIRSLSFGGMEISTDKIGPGGMPQIIVVICLFLMILIIWNSSKQKGRKESSITRKGMLVMLINIGLFGTYILFLNIIGFIISTFAYGTVAIRSMGYKSIWKSAVFMLILTVFVTLVFGRIFYVSLPRGLSLFRQLSYLIY